MSDFWITKIKKFEFELFIIKILKNMLNKEGHKSSPKHESYIAKIFNYNAQ